MPPIKMPFRPYFNTHFKVQVNTEEEHEVCDLFIDAPADLVDQQVEYLQKMVTMNPLIMGDPFFSFTHKIVMARKAELDALPKKPNRAEWEAVKKLCFEELAQKEREAQQQQRPVSVVVTPQRSLLGGVLDSILTDRLAYAGIDQNSDQLPSAQFVQKKAEATVLWDVVMGRR